MDSNVIDVLAARFGNPDVAEGYLLLGNNLRLQASLLRQQAHPQGHTVMMTLEAFHDSLFPEGTDEVAVGAGKTIDDAVARAAQVWIDGTLPVIRELFNDGQPNSSVRRLEVAAAHFEERKVFV